MNWRKMTQRDRRAVTWGAILLGPALFWSHVVRPYLSAVDDAKVRLEADRAVLKRELAVLGASDVYPAEFRVGADRLLKAAPRLVGGDDDGAAAAALAGYLRRVAQLGRASITRVEPAATRDVGGGITALPVDVSGESDLEGLLTFLRLLETGPKLLHVESLRIEANSGGTPAAGASYALTPFIPGTAPSTDVPEIISFRFTATGFTLAEREAVKDDSTLESVEPVDDGSADPEEDPSDSGAEPGSASEAKASEEEEDGR